MCCNVGSVPGRIKVVCKKFTRDDKWKYARSRPIHFKLECTIPFPVKIFTLPPKGQTMWFLCAVTTSAAVFVFNGIHHVNPVSMQQAVNAKQWPRLVGGWNSPIKSTWMKSIGDREGRKSFLSNFTSSFWCNMHTGHILQWSQMFSLMFFQ